MFRCLLQGPWDALWWGLHRGHESRLAQSLYPDTEHSTCLVKNKDLCGYRNFTPIPYAHPRLWCSHILPLLRVTVVCLDSAEWVLRLLSASEAHSTVFRGPLGTTQYHRETWAPRACAGPEGGRAVASTDC